MSITLDVLSLADCEAVRVWRNQTLVSLRTPFPLTAEQQAAFYRDVVSRRDSPHRYYAVRLPGRGRSRLAGCVGLTNLAWENCAAEISLITNPALTGRGYGRTAVRLALREAFDRLRLLSVYGECYECNTAVLFWQKLVRESGGYEASVRARKFWDGRLWGSYLFGWEADEPKVRAWLAAS